MIQNDVAHRITTQTVVAPLEFAAPKTQIADDDIVRIDLGRFAADANAVTGRCLARDGDERLGDAEAVGESDQAADTKNHDARPAGFERRAEAAGAAVVEGGHLDDPSTATAGSNGAGTFGAGKRGNGSGDK